MAVAVLPAPSSSISNPFLMASRQHISVNGNITRTAVASPRSPQPGSSSSASPVPVSGAPDSPPKAFQRFRSSIEQSIRTATRRTKLSTTAVDEAATAVARGNKAGAGLSSEDARKEKESSNMLKRLESKVNFRRGRRDSVTASPAPPSPISSRKDADKNNVPKSTTTGFGPVGSLRQASMSSPTLLASQVFPSLISAAASSPSPPPKDSPTTPTRSRVKGSCNQTPVKESHMVTPKRHSHSNSVQVVSNLPTRDPSRRHRATQSSPMAIPSSPSTPSLLTSSPTSPQTPPRRTRETASPPQTPTPPGRSSLALSSRRQGAMSSSHLPLGRPGSPTVTRNVSPMRIRISPVPRGLASTSTSDLPPSPTTPTPKPRRASIDSQRRPSDSESRTGSPSPPLRRATSPFAFPHSRNLNASTASLASPSNPEHRELIRNATTLLCKEMTRSPNPAMTETAAKEWKEAENRMALLLRRERIWGESRISQPSSGGGVTISASGEEKERRLFGDALRDGVVLCLLMNKLRSKSVVRPDFREDKRASNLNKFLAACSSYGLSVGDLFQPDDLTYYTSESLARVARTIIALVKFVDAPVDRSRYLSGQGKNPDSSPYSRGVIPASTPNLLRSASPTSAPSPTGRKRRSPPEALLAVRSNTDENKPRDNSMNTVKRDRPDLTLHFHLGNDRAESTPLKPPPRSPLRSPSGANFLNLAAQPSIQSIDQASVADSTRVLVPDSARTSVADPIVHRQSTASGTATDTTMFSSLLDFRRITSNGNTKFGTVRTVTTEATSEAPSFTPAGGDSSAVLGVDDVFRKRGVDLGVHYRERRISDVVDLSRVLEEVDESSSSSRGGRQGGEQTVAPRAFSQDREKAERIHLGKAKWPDDFLGIQAQSQPRPIPASSRTYDEDDFPRSSSPASISPPRKLAIVGATRHNESLDSLPQFPRRPSQRPRPTFDTPVLLPKESVRDASPDGIPSTSGRAVLRRHSTKPGNYRNGVYLVRGALDDPRNLNDSGDSLIPFPRTFSGEHGPGTATPSSVDSRPNTDGLGPNDRPRFPRGRFQSDIEGSIKRPRPSSYDELGMRPTRSRIGSMVNLGVGSSNASASDLMTRDSMDGSAVRKTLIIKEEGQPPTHFQLGNCIGRGQFGSVYRALNLNTGQMVAVKRIRLEGLKEEEVTQLMREVDLVKRLSHPSIVKYEGMARDDDTLSIVLEYAENGSLGQTLKAFGKLNERLVAGYVVKILEGLDYLHQSDVVHCDLKAANILTTKNGNVKLSDFGVSLNLRAMEREINDVAGTPNWMAPEVIELKGASTKSDIWSLGCTVIELLTGRPPYADVPNSMSVMFRIVEDERPPLPEDCTPLLQDFLAQCFNKNPAKRPTAEDLCEHQWLKKTLAAHKELRRQDSIPFLRRVSADYQKEAARHLPPLEIPGTPTSDASRVDGVISGSPRGRRSSNSTPLDYDPISPREHSFVKTAFGKPVTCRVCLLGVKKSAVLCEQCSLIAHTKCSVNAPPTCDLRAQLLLYAQYAQKGNPGSVYHNPLDILRDIRDIVPTSPTSEGSGLTGTQSASVDNLPPTAFKFMAAFRRSRTSLTPEPGHSASAPTPSSMPQEVKRKPAVLKRKVTTPRPQSLASDSTSPNTSSMRSAATAAESFSSRLDAATSTASANRMASSQMSSGGHSETFRSPQLVDSSVSGHSVTQDDSPETRTQKKRNKDPKSGCAIQ